MKRITRSKAIELMALYDAYKAEAEAPPQENVDEEGASGSAPASVPAEVLVYRLAHTVATPKKRKLFLVTAIVAEGQDTDQTTRSRVTYCAAAMNGPKAQAMVEELLEGGEYRIVSVEERDNPWHYASGAED